MQNVATPSAAQERGQSQLLSIFRAREFGILVFFIGVVVLLSIARPTFLTVSNVLNMARNMAWLTVMAVSMTFLITAQELDLSVGSVYGLCSLAMGLMARDLGIDLWISLLIALLVAAVIGFANGVITTYGRIPSFITTLGMLYILRAISYQITSFPVSQIDHPTFYSVLAGKIKLGDADLSIHVLWMLGFVIVGYLLMQRTQFGYYVRAVGSNRTAAELSGIRVKRVKIIAFMMSSVCAAFAGAISFAHLTSVAPTAGGGFELQVIAAVVIGGTALFGGQGTIIGTFLGAALLTVVNNGLVQLGADRLKDGFLGAIIIIAVLVHTYLQLRQQGRR